MRMASASATLALTGAESVVGSLMQPKPSADTCQSGLPKPRYCIKDLHPLTIAGSDRLLSSRKTDRKLNFSHGLDFGQNPVNCQLADLDSKGLITQRSS